MDDLVRALNRLLEAERAAVEALVKLSVLSSDGLERASLQRIGADAAWACASLHRQIEMLGSMPSRSISPQLAPIREQAQFAAGMQAFCLHQREVLRDVEALLALGLPAEVRGLLIELQRVHLPNIVWCEDQAASVRLEKRPAASSDRRTRSKRAAQQAEDTPKGQERQGQAQPRPTKSRYAARPRYARSSEGTPDGQGERNSSEGGGSFP